MNPLAAIAVKIMLDLASHIPRSAVAKVARQLLALMAVRVENASTNTIIHAAETVTFQALDKVLADIESANV